MVDCCELCDQTTLVWYVLYLGQFSQLFLEIILHGSCLLFLLGVIIWGGGGLNIQEPSQLWKRAGQGIFWKGCDNAYASGAFSMHGQQLKKRGKKTDKAFYFSRMLTGKIHNYQANLELSQEKFDHHQP